MASNVRAKYLFFSTLQVTAQARSNRPELKLREVSLYLSKPGKGYFGRCWWHALWSFAAAGPPPGSAWSGIPPGGAGLAGYLQAETRHTGDPGALGRRTGDAHTGHEQPSAPRTAPAQPGGFFVRSRESAAGTVLPLGGLARRTDGSRRPSPLHSRPSRRRRSCQAATPGPLGVRRSPCFLTGMALQGGGAPPPAGAPPHKLWARPGAPQRGRRRGSPCRPGAGRGGGMAAAPPDRPTHRLSHPPTSRPASERLRLGLPAAPAAAPPRETRRDGTGLARRRGAVRCGAARRDGLGRCRGGQGWGARAARHLPLAVLGNSKLSSQNGGLDPVGSAPPPPHVTGPGGRPIRTRLGSGPVP